MKMKDFFEHEFGLLGRRFLQIHPQEKIRVTQKGRHQEPLDVLPVKPALGCKHK
jgi:hypothetical protein